MTEGAPGPDAIQVDVEVARDFNLAMVANAVRLVRRLALTNRTNHPVRDLTVEVRLEPAFSAPWSTHISEIAPGSTFGLEAVDLAFDRAALVNQLERSDANLTVRIRVASGEEVASHSAAVSVLAYNEWSANTVPQILAAFVMPNHPAVERILTTAKDRIAKLTGSPALDGYQSHSPTRVQGLAQGIYETIQAFEVTYSNPPASFETTGQKVRTPEQVLEQRMGTCLDLSVLLAACLEQVGLNPLILVLQGHALPAVWLQEHELPEGATDDGVRLRKHADLGMLLVFDSSAVASRPLVPFAQAVRRGRAYLDEPTFRYAVDIRGARRQQFLPLPARVVGAYSTVEAAPAAPSPTSSSGRVSGAAVGTRSGSGPAKAARIPRIETWKQRLLDTSLRNRLLNFKKDGKQVLRLLGKDVPAVENALARGATLQLFPRPSAFGKADPREKRLIDDRLGEDPLEALLRDALAKGTLHVDIEPESLFARATEIFRTARESIEETGNNTLCLALGMLTWYEADSSDVARSAPILLVPVTLKRDSRASLFSLVLSGEETRVNATLVEKLRSEHGISLPELAELPEDEAGVDVTAVLNAFRAAVINHRRWDVASEAYLANASFAKFLMWADLEQRSTSLLENAVVAHLVNGKGARFPGDNTFTEPAELDRRYGPADLLCPLDADASQLAAVAAAGEGKSFVLQGPPGTGKSQTITNLIAHCLAQGKRVLFVAEKMAALEVVHRRLTRIGLAPFCLELYSNKTGKQHVLAQLQAALDAPPGATPADWDAAQARLLRDRDRLNAYADALHRDRDGLTVFKALSRLTALRATPRVELQPSCSASRAQLTTTIAAALALQTAGAALPELASAAWRGCELSVWDLGLPQRVRETLERVHSQLDGLVARLAELSVRLGVALPRSLDEADALGAIAVGLAEAPRAGNELLAIERWTEVESTAIALVRAGRGRDEAVAALEERYSDGLYALDLATLRARFDRYAGAFFLIAWWMLRGARKAMVRVVKTTKPPPPRQVAQDLGLAVEAREHTQTLERLGARGRGIFGPLWEPASRDWSTMDRTIDWARRLQGSVARLGQRVDVAALTEGPVIDGTAVRSGNAAQAHVAGIRAGLGELRVALGWKPGANGASSVDDLDGLRTQLEGWRAQHSFLREWFAYQQATRELRAIGAGALVDAVDEGRVAADQAGDVGERSALEQWLLREIAGDPALQAFHGDPHRATVASFAAGDRALLRDTAAMVENRLAARVPRGGGDVAGSSELGILQRELKKKTRHMPLRKLFRQIPALTARLKPCFLMSPLSVAQYLEPGAAKFDVVVFDEASQIPTHDAIGALARGDSAVVVGDSKQLPPTTFFSSRAMTAGTTARPLTRTTSSSWRASSTSATRRCCPCVGSTGTTEASTRTSSRSATIATTTTSSTRSPRPPRACRTSACRCDRSTACTTRATIAATGSRPRRWSRSW